MAERDINYVAIFKNPQIFIDIRDLFRNGEFYQQNDELEGALISYSSCASMIHTIFYMRKNEDLHNTVCADVIQENNALKDETIVCADLITEHNTLKNVAKADQGK